MRDVTIRDGGAWRRWRWLWQQYVVTVVVVLNSDLVSLAMTIAAEQWWWWRDL